MSSGRSRLRTAGWIGLALTASSAGPIPGTAAAASCQVVIPGDSGLRAFGNIEERVNEWNRFLRRLDPGINPARQIEAYRAKQGVPVSYSPPDDPGSLPALLPRVENLDTPCGTEVIVFARSLDAKGLPGSGLLRGERVLEIDPQGRVLGRWTVPTSQTGVAAVRGTSIMMRSRAGSLCQLPDGEQRVQLDVWLVIKPDGSFRVVEPDPKIAEPERAQCRLPENFKDSAYAGCWRFKDLDSGAVRILVFDAPCT